ncbi:hypothetical protein NEUTE2DRAFT_130100 [Neurospora tetrasperma FGSC 2509]|nr:hypothetical protein NEUTE2DRAFT_130100 [Neurospora tetrasperma FGSC 2509]
MLMFSSHFAVDSGGDDLFPERELCGLSRATLTHLYGFRWNFDSSLGLVVLWTGDYPGRNRRDSLALTKRSAYGRMRRRRLDADGDALEMLSIVDCGCPRVRGRGHWTDGNADGEKTDLSQVQKRSSGSGLATYRGRVDEGKTWTRVSQHQGRPAASPRYRRVGLLLAGYLMQCHEAQQAPNHHRTEEGRRTSNIPGTCQSGRMPRMQSPGGGSWSSAELLGFPNGPALLPTLLWFRDATKYDEMAGTNSGLGMWPPAMEKLNGREWAKLWDSDVQIRQLADW